MENYQYPSYPDSGDSSPRSREIDFENPPPWDDQQNQTYKAKFMCSYGGKIQPRTHDNQLSYVGGDTKILAVDRSIKFTTFLSKLAAVCDTPPQELTFKYQLPGEDLDALISVTNDDDLEHMMHEYDRLYRPNSKPVRMRLFLFALSANPNSSFSSDRDAVKTPPLPPSNVDYLFGLDKAVAPPPIAPSFAAVNEYRRRSEDGFAAGGDYYLQKPPEKVSPPGYWPEKQFSGEGYQTTVTTAPGGGDQAMYVIPAPGTYYHAPMVRPAAQGYYAVPRMGSEGYREQAVYGGVAQPKAAFSSAGAVKGSAYAEGYGVVRPGGVTENAAYTQVAYDSASGRQVYYTAPGGVVQYQGVADARPVGVSVAQDGKVVNKVSHSQQGSV
uniref:PB1 domain-containing protein n=1 Tax=Cajanus cajan TaxID=3821 RepID=A0A151SI44_CAJCA|nr:hypothetical protein KK1_000713 [Cajanus cajan]